MNSSAPHALEAPEVEGILAAADIEFGTYGVTGAKISAIAERAGVTVARIYEIFPDKEAISEQLSNVYLAEAMDRFGPLIADATSADAIPGIIRELVRRGAELQERHPGYYALGSVAFPAHESSPAHMVREAMVGAFVDALDRLDVRVDGDVRLVVDLAIETTRNTLFTTPIDAPERAERMAELEEMLVAYLSVRLGV